MTMVDPKIFQALTIRRALILYAETGVKANRAYTPKNMLGMARIITGKTFKPRDYLGAAAALKSWCDEKAGVTN